MSSESQPQQMSGTSTGEERDIWSVSGEEQESGSSEEREWESEEESRNSDNNSIDGDSSDADSSESKAENRNNSYSDVDENCSKFEGMDQNQGDVRENDEDDVGVMEQGESDSEDIEPEDEREEVTDQPDIDKKHSGDKVTISGVIERIWSPLKKRKRTSLHLSYGNNKDQVKVDLYHSNIRGRKRLREHGILTLNNFIVGTPKKGERNYLKSGPASTVQYDGDEENQEVVGERNGSDTDSGVEVTLARRAKSTLRYSVPEHATCVPTHSGNDQYERQNDGDEENQEVVGERNGSDTDSVVEVTPARRAKSTLRYSVPEHATCVPTHSVNDQYERQNDGDEENQEVVGERNGTDTDSGNEVTPTCKAKNTPRYSGSEHDTVSPPEDRTPLIKGSGFRKSNTARKRLDAQFCSNSKENQPRRKVKRSRVVLRQPRITEFFRRGRSDGTVRTNRTPGPDAMLTTDPLAEHAGVDGVKKRRMGLGKKLDLPPRSQRSQCASHATKIRKASSREDQIPPKGSGFQKSTTTRKLPDTQFRSILEENQPRSIVWKQPRIEIFMRPGRSDETVGTERTSPRPDAMLATDPLAEINGVDEVKKRRIGQRNTPDLQSIPKKKPKVSEEPEEKDEDVLFME